MRIALVGAPQWQRADAAPQPLARKDAALFALLAIDREPARDRVAAWLWPEAPLAGARVNLRQRLFKLRQLLDHPLVGADAAMRLQPDLSIDLLHGALPGEGRLLGDFDYGDLDAFDEWLGVQRRALLQRQIEAGLQAVQALEQAGDLDAAVGRCERLLARDPARERSWRQLMQLHYLRGDRAAAVAAFQRCEQLLSAELGIRPSDQTLQLLAQIERLQVPRPSAALPPALARPPRLVGRSDALDRLQWAWDQRRTALLLGEGGIGKTRLLDDFLRGRAGLLGLRMRPGDAGTPYAAVLPLLRQAWGRRPPGLPEGVAPELARLLPEAGPAPHPERKASQPVLWQAVETLLGAAVSGGVEVIAIDDLHHADEASLDLLRWLAGSPVLTGLRWLLAARADGPSDVSARLHEWAADAARVETVVLRPLSADGVAELLASLGLSADVVAALPTAEALHRHAGGHPFFTLETLKDALAGGVGALPQPAGATAMLQRRLLRLRPASQDLLRVLALADGDLPADVAAEVLGTPLLHLAPAWAELEEAQLTRAGVLAHDLVREVARALVPQPLRPGLHAALATAMARLGNVPAGRLARHWWQAGRPAESAAAWRAAAAQARQAARLREVDELLTAAADAWEAAGDHAAAFEARCDALESAVWRGADQDTLARARELVPMAADDPARARVMALQAQTLMSLLRPADALEVTRVGLPLAQPGSRVHNDLMSLHGRALAMAGRVDEALTLLDQAREAAERLDDTGRQLVALSALAHALAIARQPGRALQVQQRATALARRGADPVELTIHLCNTASAAWITGDASLVAASAAEALPLMDRLGVQGGQRLYTCSLAALAAAQQGRFDAARGWMHGVAPDVRAATGASLQRLVGVIEGWVHLQRGDAAGARAGLGPGGAEGVSTVVEAQAQLLLARAAIDAGQDGHDALQNLQQLLVDTPALADEPLVALEAGRHGSPQTAVVRLTALADTQQRRGAPALALSLDLVALERLRELDPAAASERARALLPRMAGDLHPLSHPPQAWWTLSEALRAWDPALADHALRQARQWLERAAATVAGEAERRSLLCDNPRHRQVLADPARA